MRKCLHYFETKMYLFYISMCVCVTQVCLVPSEVRRVLTLELRVVVSCHVSCGNQVLVLCKSTCSSQLSHLSSSLSLLITQLCSSFFKHIFIFVCVYVHMLGEYMCIYGFSTCRGQKRQQIPLELELQAVVSYPTWMLVTELLGKQANT